MSANMPIKWGYTSYSRIPLIRPDGRRLYQACLRADHDTTTYTILTIRFWAKRPIIGLKDLLRQPRTASQLMTADGTTLN